jgi:hypothetical protein
MVDEYRVNFHLWNPTHFSLCYCLYLYVLHLPLSFLSVRSSADLVLLMKGVGSMIEGKNMHSVFFVMAFWIWYGFHLFLVNYLSFSNNGIFVLFTLLNHMKFYLTTCMKSIPIMKGGNWILKLEFATKQTNRI